jgi:antitoxin (DNA-binding transcriptional repressor) of toxin-antitoxin stability system
MQTTLNVRQFRSVMPNLKSALAHDQEIIIVTKGEPVARVTPVFKRPRFESREKYFAQFGGMLPDSTPDIRAERDLR